MGSTMHHCIVAQLFGRAATVNVLPDFATRAASSTSVVRPRRRFAGSLRTRTNLCSRTSSAEHPVSNSRVAEQRNGRTTPDRFAINSLGQIHS